MWGFRREVPKNCACLGYHAASSGNFLPMFRDTLEFLSLEDFNDILSRNIGKKFAATRCVITQKSAVLTFFIYHAST